MRGNDRAAFTIVEVLIGACLVSLVVGVVMVLTSGGQRMSRSAQLTVAVQGALLIREQITLDLRQAGVKPGDTGPFQLGPRSLAFYRVLFEPAAIRLRPVRYVAEPTARGNFRVVRQEFQGASMTSQHTIQGGAYQRPAT
ncbi:MAG: hypothetical protein HY815_32760 [Candidatus Riflebacteria bacterium]|nr:hypothetical protein [Candidatus Riflebacteria bacterium]